MIGPGIHRNLAMAAYIGDPCERPSLSASGVTRLLQRSPAAFASMHPRLTSWPELLKETTDAASVGTAIHAILSGDGDSVVSASPSDFMTKTGKPCATWACGEAKAWWDAQLTAGLMPLDREDHARAMQASAVATIELEREFGEWPRGLREITIVWERFTEADPVLCRTRPDFLPDEKSIVEIKTTNLELTDHNIQKMLVAKWGIQRAFQVAGVRSILGDGDRSPISHTIFVIEQNPPFDCCFVPNDIADSWMNTANLRIDRAANIFAKCLAEGKWPGRERYSRPVQPAYDLAEFDEIEAMEEV